MRERKYVKIKVDMFEDTKFKIIDSMAERDTIYYIWTRILALCGKINNNEGYLFMSKNMPYTIEILSLEFNRTVEQIRNAIDVFIKLNMIARDDDISAFKVCNWGKHQGIRKNKVEREIEVESIEKEEANLERKEDKVEELPKEENLNFTNNEETKVDEEMNKKVHGKLINIDTSKKKVIKPNSSLSEVCADQKAYINKIKSKKSKRKRKGNEISVNDEDANNLDSCGFDIPAKQLGTVISSFDFS